MKIAFSNKVSGRIGGMSDQALQFPKILSFLEAEATERLKALEEVCLTGEALIGFKDKLEAELLNLLAQDNKRAPRKVAIAFNDKIIKRGVSLHELFEIKFYKALYDLAAESIEHETSFDILVVPKL